MKTVTAAILQRDGAILLARRASGQKLAGYWEFPGGKVEAGETLQSCLEREISEELNWVVQAGEVLATSEYVYEHGAIRLVALAAEIVSGAATLTVHDRLEWVPIGRLLEYRLAPADIPIAQSLLRRWPLTQTL
ncbi:(deoxy)nucleoside triphosphate pyrophosphohydrolase [Desulfobulbus propionicus]|jgi:8-oxo-dGTP diphosphatase